MRIALFLLLAGAVVAVVRPATVGAQAASPAAKTAAKGAPGAAKTNKVATSGQPRSTHAAAGAAKKTTSSRGPTGKPAGSGSGELAASDDVRSGAASLAPTAGVTLRDAPDGQPIATFAAHATLQALAHDRGWVRVRSEGWVKESDVAPIDSTRAMVSAADLRTDPDAARGKHVRWDVEVLAMSTADPLRKGLNPDEPYLLVRGPGTESALLYVAIPPDMVSAARAVASLAPVPVLLAATVREGRSEPVGVPILVAQSLTRR
jgi:hypothetical protein